MPNTPTSPTAAGRLTDTDRVLRLVEVLDGDLSYTLQQQGRLMANREPFMQNTAARTLELLVKERDALSSDARRALDELSLYMHGTQDGAIIRDLKGEVERAKADAQRARENALADALAAVRKLGVNLMQGEVAIGASYLMLNRACDAIRALASPKAGTEKETT